MPRHHFISYSRVEASEFAKQLHDELEAEKIWAWIDQHDIKAGRNWDAQVDEAVRDSITMLFVMTPDSVMDNSQCHKEWSRALRYKIEVIPLRCHPDVEPPFRLQDIQWIDFTDGFDAGIARLRKHFRWRDTPEGQLQTLMVRLKSAERDLPRAGDEHEQTRIAEEIAALKDDIDGMQALVDDRQTVIERAAASIEARLAIERQPADAPRKSSKFINPPPMAAALYFQDRFDETKQIADFLQDESLRMMTLFGTGGVGKTATVCRVLKALESRRLPDELGSLAVDGILYLSTGSGPYRVSVPTLFTGLSKLLPADAVEAFDAINYDASISTTAKMQSLLGHFTANPVVVLLDNFEDIVDLETHQLRDADLDKALRALLAAPQHAVKVIITTRVKPRDLMLEFPERQRVYELEKGLNSPYAENILREMDSDGALNLRDASDVVLGKVREVTRGFPRALQAFVAILRSDRNTQRDDLLAELERWHNKQPVDTPSEGVSHIVEKLVGEAFNRLDSTARLVMQALAIYNRPVPAVAVDYLLQAYAPGLDSASVLRRLVNMHLVHRDGNQYFTHPADSVYALTLVPRTEESAKAAGIQLTFTHKALFERAASYYESVRKPRDEWKSLQDIAAQLAEIDMRYAAEDYSSSAKLLNTLTTEYLMPWGHPHLIVKLHERLQGKLQELPDKIDSLHNLGTAYEILGQTNEAITQYREALNAAQEVNNKGAECGLLNSLGAAFIDLGQTESATQHFEEGLEIARAIGDRVAEGRLIAGMGSVFWSRGEWHKAMDHCRQALERARQHYNQYEEARCLGVVGGLYLALGQVTEAIASCRESLDISREIGYRLAEGRYLGNLGLAYEAAGELTQAMECFQSGLSITRDIGDRIAEIAYTCNWGMIQLRIGEMVEAAKSTEEALKLSQQFCYPAGEAVSLINLGFICGCLGNTSSAVDYYDEALAVVRTIGDRHGECKILENVGYIRLVSGNVSEAIRLCRQAVEIADEIRSVHLQVEVRCLLALVTLCSGDSSAADHLVTEAVNFEYLPDNHYTCAIAGVVAFQNCDIARAQELFTVALVTANELVGKSYRNYNAWDAKGLATAGLALGFPDSDAYLRQAIEAYQTARAITSAPGLVAEVLLQFDALAVADTAGLLASVRSAAAGEQI